MRWSRRTTAVLAAAAFAVGGCGGDDDGGGGGLSKADLDRQSGEICEDSQRQINEVPEPQNIEDAAQASAYFEDVIAIADDAYAKLDALEPEEDLQANYDAYLAQFKKSRDFLAGIQEKAEAQDPSGLQELQAELEAGTLEKASQDAARKAGLTRCAESDDETADAGGGDTAGAEHGIEVVYDEPQNADEEAAKTLLQVGGTDGVAEGFSQNFAFPVDLTIHANSGEGSPHYDPSTKTINLYYGFVNQTGAILRQGQPGIKDEEFGKQLAAVDAFILIHELGHAFVDVFQIPITGREEDAVDGMATVFFTDAVPNGHEYAFDAARFFSFLQNVQGEPGPAQFADEHSLSIQRAFDIVCSVAGASEESLQEVAQLEILPVRRLQRCPAEYEQKSRAWKTLLQPHLRDQAAAG
jgi:hypothetical protein